MDEDPYGEVTLSQAVSDRIVEKVRKEQHQPDNISTVGALV